MCFPYSQALAFIHENFIFDPSKKISVKPEELCSLFKRDNFFNGKKLQELGLIWNNEMKKFIIPHFRHLKDLSRTCSYRDQQILIETFEALQLREQQNRVISSTDVKLSALPNITLQDYIPKDDTFLNRIIDKWVPLLALKFGFNATQTDRWRDLIIFNHLKFLLKKFQRPIQFNIVLGSNTKSDGGHSVVAKEYNENSGSVIVLDSNYPDKIILMKVSGQMYPVSHLYGTKHTNSSKANSITMSYCYNTNEGCKEAYRYIRFPYERKWVSLLGSVTFVSVNWAGYYAEPREPILKILTDLSRLDRATTVLISGRAKKDLEKWFPHIPLCLVAEHGVWIRSRVSDWNLIKPLTNEWKPKLLPILEMYTDRLPGSCIEEKEFSLVWHYRDTDLDLATQRAKELMNDLVQYTANVDVQVIQGNNIVEIRNAGVNKGIAGIHFLSKDIYDFILAIGDDVTDEDLFKVLPSTAYSIRVGMTESFARFNLKNTEDVLPLLERMVTSMNL